MIARLRLMLAACGGSLLLLLLPGTVKAQPLRVYSELQRVDPYGNIIVSDKAPRPREILSPALGRNAFASFRIVVTLPAGSRYQLGVGLNPDNAFAVSLYKERNVKRGDTWYPDKLERVSFPYDGTVPDVSGSLIEGQRTVTFWMDLWVPAGAPVRRVKVEPILWTGEYWHTYPMEVRVVAARVPDTSWQEGRVDPLDAPADAPARDVLKSYLCGGEMAAAGGPPTLQQFLRRNALQDMALARVLEQERSRDMMTALILQRVGSSDLQAWCAAPSYPAEHGAEWYLRVRDLLLRMVD